MYYSLKTNAKRTHFITTITEHPIEPPLSSHDRTVTRSEAIIGSDSYKASLKRAFARAKAICFFNPDMTEFITLTYKANELSHTTALYDFKKFLMKEKYHRKKEDPLNRNTPLKYIYVFERQKRGAIHIHMIAGPGIRTDLNRNGYRTVRHWKHGFSSVLTISDFDNNFRPYLYLLKYMAKAQRVGKSFIHTSRNFDKIEAVDYAHYIERLTKEKILYTEDQTYVIGQSERRIVKQYHSATTNHNQPN